MNKLEKDSFRQGVYDIVRHIPHGRATTYGAIAKAAGYHNLSRLAGKIIAESSEKDLPAHRVVNSQGSLSGKDAFGNSGEMQRRLEAEGIIIKNNRIENWDIVFWNPLEEIRLD